MKQMMINGGHKGMTQSSTFHYNNGVYQPVFEYPTRMHPSNLNNSVQYPNQYMNYQPMASFDDKSLPINNTGGYPINTPNNIFLGTAKSMKTSQDPYAQDPHKMKDCYKSKKVSISAIQSNIFLQNNQQNQLPSYYVNSSTNASDNFWYAPQ